MHLVLLTVQSCKCKLADKSTVYILGIAATLRGDVKKVRWGPLKGFSSYKKKIKKRMKSMCFLFSLQLCVVTADIFADIFQAWGDNSSKTHTGSRSMGTGAGSLSLFLAMSIPTGSSLGWSKKFSYHYNPFCNNFFSNSYVGENHEPAHYHLNDILSLCVSVSAYTDDLFLKFCHRLSVSNLDDSAQQSISTLFFSNRNKSLQLVWQTVPKIYCSLVSCIDFGNI